MSELNAEQVSVESLIEDARALAGQPSRRFLGITGAPGAGKSTLAGLLVEALGPELAVLVPMDGFHLANEELERLGRRDRKGAHDTFDDGGYLALLTRLSAQTSDPAAATVYAPRYSRDIEESLGSAIPVSADIPLVVSEGNYLLLDRDAWPRAHAVFDQVWFVAPTSQLRLERLVQRHVAHGKSPTDALRWSTGSDQRNAELIEATAVRADRVVRLDP